MPKIYSEEEREHIIVRLKEEANALMLEKGVKKTTVDQLGRDGSFVMRIVTMVYSVLA